jgi:hypothetical protein
MDTDLTWTLPEAVILIQQIERWCPEAGCHVALTGGVLYKHGPRKDLDILFYRIRQEPIIDVQKLIDLLQTKLGMEVTSRRGWVFKARWRGKPIDMFFPEEEDMSTMFQYGADEDE